MNYSTMLSFADKIRELRQQKGDPLRKVASFLDIDQAILSKIENGKRIATRANVIKLEEYYGVEPGTLLVLWLSDKIIHEVSGEVQAIEAIALAEKRIGYLSGRQVTKAEIIKKIKEYFRNQKTVRKAWLFGSYARDDHDIDSDIDILVRVPDKKSFTLFDLAEIKHQLEKLIPTKVDVVMEGAVNREILKRITPELILIYET
ncbi:MAG: nucleotidyltransferase domain-containing protein [Bacteroidales bacterium]|nr:nucleotidyltransferase domain-containing protein [Bacteroidales bacterium]MDT8373091.1 nucleotidyltransferase domain-containing protein [Bacteroidales bacterium]